MSVLDYLERKKGEWEDKLYIPQKRAFLEWANGVLNAGDIVLVTVTGREERYTAIHQNSNPKSPVGDLGSPLREIRNPQYQTHSLVRRYGASKTSNTLRLVMCLPGEFEKILTKRGEADQQQDWQKIFDSSLLEIWEWREYYIRRGQPLPLRFGFSRQEKELMVRFVRKEAQKLLAGSFSIAAEKGAVEAFPLRFREPVSLGAALWIEGELRSSVIMKDMPLDAALARAAREVPFDPRFKPVRSEEFGRARLEITVVHKPWMPLAKRELGQAIDPTHGYRISWRERRGWYFPEVFNCTRFSGMPDLLGRLAEDKAGIPRSSLSQANAVAFEVTDFVEAKDRGRILDLAGPLVQTGKSYGGYEREFSEDLENVLHAAAQYLARIQEGDGNIPPEFNPLTGKTKQADWIRQGLSAGALIFAGQILKDASYQEAGQRALGYMEQNFFSHPALSARTRSAALVYYGKTLMLLGRGEEAREIARRLLPGESEGPISDLQLASFLVSLGETSPEFLEEGKRRLKRILEDYDQRVYRHEGMQLALFPEAVRVLLRLSDITGEKFLREKAKTVMRWHASQQLPDGSFPIVPGSRFAYSRGTGKVFEVLALEPEEYQAALLRVFSWLRDMQYNEENTYFVSEKIRPQALGGFRHDALNPEAWTDAAAHVLIGGARLLHFLKTGNKSREF